MNFWKAFEFVTKRISRKAWNRKMYVYYIPGDNYKVCKEVNGKEFDIMIPRNASFAIKNVDNTVSTWVPSVNDYLAED